MTIAGAVFLDKPAGVTSFGALATVKRAFATKKVGHTGTLDRFATGLLIALVGRATKLAQLVTGLDKTYEAVIRFGEETETLDPEGKLVGTGTVPERSVVDRVLKTFMGTIRQRPPAYSAVHIGGERAYRLALGGVDVAVPEREVSIHEIAVRRYVPPDLTVSVRCSSGTYIRSLARDLAIAAESRGHLVYLRRTSVGPFIVDEAPTSSEPDPARDLVPLEEFIPRIPRVEVTGISAAGERAMATGRSIEEGMLERPEGELLAVFSAGGSLCGVLRNEGSRYRYVYNANGAGA